MSFWAKKENTVSLVDTISSHTDILKQKIADVEIRMTTFENSSNKREKIAFKTIEEQQQSIQEKVSSLEKFTQEKVSSLEKFTQEKVSSLEKFTQEKVSSLEKFTQETKEKLVVFETHQTTLTDYKKLIEELQYKQNILEERIAVYDEKMLNLKILTTRVEAFLDEAKNQNQIPLTSTVKTTPKVFVPAVTTNKQPSWVKKAELEPSVKNSAKAELEPSVKNSAKAELEPSVKKAKEEVKEEMKDDNQ
jgi:hypothetical protein